MKKWLCLALPLLALLSPLTVAAHEFWMLPGSFLIPPGGKTSLNLASGEDFPGESGDGALAVSEMGVSATAHDR
jgi:hypothetical protein